jgi:hypothetical protein
MTSREALSPLTISEQISEAGWMLLTLVIVGVLAFSVGDWWAL